MSVLNKSCTFKIYSAIRLSSRKCVINSAVFIIIISTTATTTTTTTTTKTNTS